MRRRLILTVAASVTMVLLAMLVPMVVLLREYALEERVSRAALEVQATETVVSGQDPGAVSVYVDRINRADPGVETSVFYPDGTVVGPIDPDEKTEQRVVEARVSGQARVDDSGGGVRFLIPVSLGGNTPAADLTPVILVQVDAPGRDSGLFRTWLLLAGIGLVLLAGALLLADRIGRSFVAPIRRLASGARELDTLTGSSEPLPVSGPPEVQDLAAALNRLVGRVQELLERERRNVSDLSHRLRTPITALRLRIEGLEPGPERTRLGGDLDELEQLVDHVVREARRSEREGLVPGSDGVVAIADRVRFWEPLAEDQGRRFELEVGAPGPVPVRASEQDLVAMVDVLLDNVFSHTPEGAPIAVRLEPREGGGLVLTVDDGGPGFPAGIDPAARGASGAGSTGLGLSIVQQTATHSGGGLLVGSSDLGGARAVVDLGPAG